MSRISRALLALMVVLLAAANVWAQATAQVNGTVADASGAENWRIVPKRAYSPASK